MTTKLLIVDDEPFTVEMLETFLQINGYQTIGAFSGEDGLVLLRVEKPEIMILDLMLPDIEGYEVCRRLRSQPDSAGIPVLILSARSESSSRARAMDAGADAYLTKPIKFPELLDELERLRTVRRVAEVTQPATPPVEAKPDPIVPPPTASILESKVPPDVLPTPDPKPLPRIDPLSIPAIKPSQHLDVSEEKPNADTKREIPDPDKPTNIL